MTHRSSPTTVSRDLRRRTESPLSHTHGPAETPLTSAQERRGASVAHISIMK